jgi:hypothetical protein
VASPVALPTFTRRDGPQSTYRSARCGGAGAVPDNGDTLQGLALIAEVIVGALLIIGLVGFSICVRSPGHSRHDNHRFICIALKQLKIAVFGV